MNPKMLLHSALALLAAVSTATAQDQPPAEAASVAQTLVDAYLAAFNKGDVRALATLYADDVQFTTDDGATVSGRTAVIGNLTKFFAKNKGAKLDLKIDSARFLTPDVLVEKGLATVDGETTRYVCNYVKKDGAWQITELDETILPPADAAVAALEELDWLVGSWKDNTPGISVDTTVNWTKNHHFLTRSVTVTREDEDPSEATEVIGYDPVAGRLRSWVFDSEGGYGEGVWNRDGNKWLITFKGTGTDGITSSAEHLITFVNPRKFTWESFNRQRDGQALPNTDKIEVVRTPAN